MLLGASGEAERPRREVNSRGEGEKQLRAATALLPAARHEFMTPKLAPASCPTVLRLCLVLP